MSEITERDRGEYLGDVPHVSDDLRVKDRHREDVILGCWLALICGGSVLYLMWLEGAIGGAS